METTDLVTSSVSTSTTQIVLPLTSYIIKLCRRFHLLPNERITILSRADEFQVIQYCLALRNKKSGKQFEAEPAAAVELFDLISKNVVLRLDELIKSFLDAQISNDSDRAEDESEKGIFSSQCVKKKTSQEENGQTKCENVSQVPAEPKLSDIADTMEESDEEEIKKLYEVYKTTSNQFSVLDLYTCFVREAMGSSSELHQFLTSNVQKLDFKADLSDFTYLQDNICGFLKAFRTKENERSTIKPSQDKNMSFSNLIMSSGPTRMSTPSRNTECHKSFETSPDLTKTPVNFNLNQVATPKTPFTPLQRKELQKIFVRDVFKSYLHLLVNSRSQLALARVFNIPDRGLDQLAFTHLKHEASAVGLSMYQTLSSFMLRVQLGGKGYAPSASSPLMEYLKGLGALLDLTQKLQTIVEEVFDVRCACRRVVNVIKNNLMQCKSGKFVRCLVEPAAQFLHEQFESIIADREKALEIGNSPEKDACNGGSVLGQKCLKVLQEFLDRSAVISTQLDDQLMTDVRFSSQTPTRFPCLLTQFRSPALLDFEEKDELPKSEMVLVEQRKAKATFIVSAALCIEADDPGDIMLTQRTLSSIDVLPCSTIVHPREGSEWSSNEGCDLVKPKVKKKSTAGNVKGACTAFQDVVGEITTKKRPLGGARKGKRRLPTSGLDQENIACAEGPVPDKTRKRSKNENQDEISGCSPKSSRGQTTKDEGRKEKSVRRRLLPQVKGQAKITGFFKV